MEKNKRLTEYMGSELLLDLSNWPESKHDIVEKNLLKEIDDMWQVDEDYGIIDRLINEMNYQNQSAFVIEYSPVDSFSGNLKNRVLFKTLINYV